MSTITREVAEKAKEMLRSGQTKTDIARMLGITPATVRRISKRPTDPEWDGIQPPTMEGPAQFCPVCRVHVQMPCLACQLRARMARRAPV